MSTGMFAAQAAAGGDYEQYGHHSGATHHMNDATPRKAMLYEKRSGTSGLLKITVTKQKGEKSCPRSVRALVCIDGCKTSQGIVRLSRRCGLISVIKCLAACNSSSAVDLSLRFIMSTCV